MNSLGISDELKQKLQDVMVDRHKLTLGKTLGEGIALFVSFFLHIESVSFLEWSQYHLRATKNRSVRKLFGHT